MRAAWGEVVPTFGTVSPLIGATNRTQLEGVGLVGFRLQFELGAFEHARAELLDHAPEIFASPRSATAASVTPTSPLAPPKEWQWWRRLRKFLGRCFKSADVILGSLAKVFTQLDIVKQFKEGLEAVVDLTSARTS
jgi:hypothetical protein